MAQLVVSVLQVFIRCWGVFFPGQLAGRWLQCHSKDLLCLCRFKEGRKTFQGNFEEAVLETDFEKKLCMTVEAVQQTCQKLISVKRGLFSFKYAYDVLHLISHFYFFYARKNERLLWLIAAFFYCMYSF